MAGTERGAAALAKDLAAAGLRASDKKDLVPGPGMISVRPGHLTGGVQFPFARYALITGRLHGTAEA